MYVQVKELPTSMQQLLKKLEYYKKDIYLQATEEVSPSSAGGDGLKYYFAALNLETGESAITWGSWGGSNLFNPQNRVDLDTKSYQIPPNGLVVKGCIGYTAHATIYLQPANIQQFLPKPAEALNNEEFSALYAYGAIKAGQYRTAYLLRHRVQNETIENLVKRGYLKKNKANAVQITTKGKNARCSDPVRNRY